MWGEEDRIRGVGKGRGMGGQIRGRGGKEWDGADRMGSCAGAGVGDCLGALDSHVDLSGQSALSLYTLANDSSEHHR